MKRTIIGIVCILLALVAIFAVAPALLKASDAKVIEYRTNKALPAGYQIAETDIVAVEVNADTAQKGIIGEKEKLIGMFTKSEMFAGDTVTENKIAPDYESIFDAYERLDGSQVIYSSTITSFAGGISGKIESGDLLSFIIKSEGKRIIESEFATDEMIEFLTMCIRYGVSLVVAGATSSGKTTLLNALLTTIPDEKRIYTIESGSRELSLVRRDERGMVTNNVVHTLSRPSENETYDISQEQLVVASLRFNPDIVCVGEMRDCECYSAVEASLTGHTVVSTVHATTASAAHMRIALLCQKRFPIDFQTSMTQAAMAFPLVVYAHKLENHERKITDISECEILPSGERKYRQLYSYQILKNINDGQHINIEGKFVKPEPMSDSLRKRLLQFGAPQDKLSRFLMGGTI